MLRPYPRALLALPMLGQHAAAQSRDCVQPDGRSRSCAYERGPNDSVVTVIVRATNRDGSPATSTTVRARIPVEMAFISHLSFCGGVHTSKGRVRDRLMQGKGLVKASFGDCKNVGAEPHPPHAPVFDVTTRGGRMRRNMHLRWRVRGGRPCTCRPSPST